MSESSFVTVPASERLFPIMQNRTDWGLKGPAAPQLLLLKVVIMMIIKSSYSIKAELETNFKHESNSVILRYVEIRDDELQYCTKTAGSIKR